MLNNNFGILADFKSETPGEVTLKNNLTETTRHLQAATRLYAEHNRLSLEAAALDSILKAEIVRAPETLDPYKIQLRKQLDEVAVKMDNNQRQKQLINNKITDSLNSTAQLTQQLKNLNANDPETK